jgi:hypothetical protein
MDGAYGKSVNVPVPSGIAVELLATRLNVTRGAADDFLVIGTNGESANSNTRPNAIEALPAERKQLLVMVLISPRK